MTFRVEWGARKTWTDYFDDVSTVYVFPIATPRGPRPNRRAIRRPKPYNLDSETGSEGGGNLRRFTSEAILGATIGMATFWSLWVFA